MEPLSAPAYARVSLPWTPEQARAAQKRSVEARKQTTSLRAYMRRLVKRDPARLELVVETVFNVACDPTSRYWPEAIAFLSKSLDGDRRLADRGGAFNVTIQNALQARLPPDGEPMRDAHGVEARQLERDADRRATVIDVGPASVDGAPCQAESNRIQADVDAAPTDAS